jgi:hypothetical protein
MVNKLILAIALTFSLNFFIGLGKSSTLQSTVPPAAMTSAEAENASNSSVGTF